MGELSGRVAIVTGGSSGMGASMVKAFAREGASVVSADVNLQRAEEVVKQVKATGGVALAVKADCSKADEVNQMVQVTLDRFQKIDILVNVAGIGHGSGSGRYSSPEQVLVENYPEEDWDKIMSVNLKSMFLCSKAVIPTMKKQRSGNIVNISSGAGRTGAGFWKGHSAGPAYAASKAGMINLSKTLARQLAPYKIRVNCITPGDIAGADPDGTQTAGFPYTEEQKEEARRIIPLGEIGRPIDIANVVLFLVSDRAAYVDGVTLDVDGGKRML